MLGFWRQLDAMISAIQKQKALKHIPARCLTQAQICRGPCAWGRWLGSCCTMILQPQCRPDPGWIPQTGCRHGGRTTEGPISCSTLRRWRQLAGAHPTRTSWAPHESFSDLPGRMTRLKSCLQTRKCLFSVRRMIWWFSRQIRSAFSIDCHLPELYGSLIWEG